MKKSLLFIVAAATSLSGFAQTTDTLTNFPPSIISGRSYSDFAHYATGSYYSQIDSPAALPIQDQVFGPGVHGTQGYLSGTTTPSQILGAAECFNPHLSPVASMSITGALSIWAGGANSSSSSMQIKINVWNQIDTTTRIALGTGPTGADSVTGFPSGTPILSVTQPVSSLAVNNIDLPIPKRPAGAPAYQLTTFTSTPVTGPFFLGFEFASSYDMVAGDTLTLCNAQHFATTTAGILDYYLFTNSTYTMYLSRNCAKISSGWTDYYSTIGASETMNLCIVPIVEYSSAVGNINKNNLTTFSAYPNPAVNSLNIKYALQHSSDVTITIMDMAGRVLNTINQSKVSTGEHVVNVSTSDLAAGNYVYLVRTAEGDALATKFTVAK